MRKFIFLFSLIFFLPSTVLSDDSLQRWVLIFTNGVMFTETSHHVNIHQTFDEFTGQTYQSEAECYRGLKNTALRANQTNPNFQGADKFTIEILDDIRISAKSERSGVFHSIKCIEIKISN